MTSNQHRVQALTGLTFLSLLIVAGCCKQVPEPGEVKDEALRAGRTVSSFPAADDPYFDDMDQMRDVKHQLVHVDLKPYEVEGRKGRITWLLWTGGNDRLWDALSSLSVGNLDLLKTISSHPNLKGNRDNRWSWMGLVNEPCFEKPTGPDPKRFGLWLDQRKRDCPPDPFEDETKYPGVKIGARGITNCGGTQLPVGSYYGFATGI